MLLVLGGLGQIMFFGGAWWSVDYQGWSAIILILFVAGRSLTTAGRHMQAGHEQAGICMQVLGGRQVTHNSEQAGICMQVFGGGRLRGVDIIIVNRRSGMTHIPPTGK